MNPARIGGSHPTDQGNIPENTQQQQASQSNRASAPTRDSRLQGLTRLPSPREILNATQVRRPIRTANNLVAAPSQPAQVAAGQSDATIAHGDRLIGHAQANMRDGMLHLTGVATGTRVGNRLYEGYYVPSRPIAIQNSRFSDFAPGQASLIREHVDFYVDEFNEGEHAQINPVQVAPTEDGQLTIVDGHHRLAAGLLLGRSIPLSVDVESEPAQASNWSAVAIREEASDHSDDE